MVFLQSCETYDREVILEKVRAVFDACGGISRYARPGIKVVIKPNLVARKKPEEAATTHPSLVWACAKLCREAGAEVLIAESPGGLYDKAVLKALYRTCGIEAAAADSGAQLNYDTSVTRVENPDGLYLKTLDVLTPLAQADVILDLAKLKTHGMMVYTGAVKNMFGAIAGVGKAEYHCKMPSYDAFADTLIDIFLAVKPHLSIIDGVVSMHKDGPTAGEPLATNLLVASEDAFEADCAALQCIQAEGERVPMVRAARRRGLWPETISVTGLSLEEATRKDFMIRYNDDCERLHFSDGFLGKMLLSVMKPRPDFTKKCRSCGECAKCCPVQAITVEKGKRATADLDRCIRCYCCQELCPFKAVRIKKTLLAKVVTR